MNANQNPPVTPEQRTLGLQALANSMLKHELSEPDGNCGMGDLDSGFSDDSVAGQEFEAHRAHTDDWY